MQQQDQMAPSLGSPHLPKPQTLTFSPAGQTKTHHCKLCGLFLSSANALLEHTRIHTGERPFGCGVCGKRFTQKAHLNIHKRTHTGEKPYACDICDKRFAQSSHLTCHKRMHLEEKPFKCMVCGSGFTQKQRLDLHLRKHFDDAGNLRTTEIISMRGQPSRLRFDPQGNPSGHLTGMKNNMQEFQDVKPDLVPNWDMSRISQSSGPYLATTPANTIETTSNYMGRTGVHTSSFQKVKQEILDLSSPLENKLLGARSEPLMSDADSDEISSESHSLNSSNLNSKSPETTGMFMHPSGYVSVSENHQSGSSDSLGDETPMSDTVCTSHQICQPVSHSLDSKELSVKSKADMYNESNPSQTKQIFSSDNKLQESDNCDNIDLVIDSSKELVHIASSDLDLNLNISPSNGDISLPLSSDSELLHRGPELKHNQSVITTYRNHHSQIGQQQFMNCNVSHQNILNKRDGNLAFTNPSQSELPNHGFPNFSANNSNSSTNFKGTNNTDNIDNNNKTFYNVQRQRRFNNSNTNSRPPISLVNFTAEELISHLMKREDVHKCTICGVIFQDAAMYHLHRNTHDKYNPLACNICGQEMKDKYDFYAHLLNMHQT